MNYNILPIYYIKYSAVAIIGKICFIKIVENDLDL